MANPVISRLVAAVWLVFVGPDVLGEYGVEEKESGRSLADATPF